MDDNAYDSAAGSVAGGDRNAPQLIVDSRAVVLEYARPGSEHRPLEHDGDRGGNNNGNGGRAPLPHSALKSDWLCESVSVSPLNVENTE